MTSRELDALQGGERITSATLGNYVSRPGYAAYLRRAITPFALIARGLQDRTPALRDAMASSVV